MENKQTTWLQRNAIILTFVVLKLLIHLLTNHNYGFHRDEFLYLAEGDHLDWGYLEVPPFISILAFIVNNVLGSSIEAVRLFPTLFGAAIVALSGLMAREMGAKRFGEFLACFTVLFSLVFLRVSLLFQPVIIEVFFWTLFGYLLIRYINEGTTKWLIYLGIAFGLGMMNKYSSAFFIFSMGVAMLFTNERKLLINKYFWISALIAFLIFLPNLFWQYSYNFPVVHHMKELRETQLVNVKPINFFVDQLLMNITALPVVLLGFYALIFTRSRYKLIGLTALFVILLLLITSGKSYYTIGVYPMVMAGGAVFIEKITSSKLAFWFRPALLVSVLLLLYPLLPITVPYLSLPKMIEYKNKMVSKGIDSPFRWEDGNVHELPQDYADMFGWDEMAEKAAKVYHSLPPEEQKQTIIFCGNYGFAGALHHYRKQYNLPEIHSLNASFMLWMPPNPTFKTMIYIDFVRNNDEDAFHLFKSVKKMGEVTNPYAREKGTGVYLLQEPIQNIDRLVESAIKEERSFLVRN
ncbi:glycosyltransferase family 39 protein [Solitalea canadensis]|nr:glycosyltransferase family 39 protein [Solitalea canadensis]